jgi:hypothetical protein
LIPEGYSLALSPLVRPLVCGERELIVVENWVEELKGKLGN